ncbi:MAG: PKD domain-containing protein, partial [Candidatus Cloacimonetes bacterium]|nr:PKD domain-containing protein [Candidatus Cloacimonadota bacterium]
TVACTGDTIYFTDLSTSIDDPITSWAWDFQNDGIIDSNEPNPLCVYIEEGLYSVSLTVADDYGRESDTLIKDDYITIASYDPVLNLPEEFTFNEDESSELDLEEYIEYEPIEELQVIWSGNDQIHIESEGLVLYFSANLNWFGQEQVTIYLSNEASRSIVSDSIIVIVEPVNDAPMISIPDTLSFIGNKIFDFGELDYVSDVDGDMLDLSYSGNENISVSIEGLLVSFESNGWYGSENIVFAVNDNVQRTAALDTVLVIAYPNWSVNPPDYEYSASIWGIVLLDDIEVDVTSGMLSCFVGEECRGIASFDDGSIIDYNEYFGHIIFLPMIYSNVTSGETIDFLYFDAETVGIYQVAESIDFVADVVVGDGYDPFVFHASTVSTIDISKAMIPGWNWFSLNVTGEDMSTNSVLASIGTNASNIKNQTQSAMYYPGPGWLGSLNTINNITFYKLSVNNPDTLEYSGMPVEISEITYDLTAGWNWISYAPQAAENINYALATLDDGSNIKSQTQSAMYYPGPGWLGSLTTLQPLDGYMLNMNAPDQLIYPEPEPAVRSFADISEFKVESAGWSVNPHEYEFNGVVNAEIVGESQIDPVDYELAVFCGDECRGIAEVLDYTQLFGGVYHSVMVYSNELAGDEMRVVLYDKASADILETDIYFTFIADMVSGDFIDPVQIMLPGDETKIITATRLVSCYPNPFNPETNISFELAGDEMVRIEVYNIKGQKVATVLEQEMTAGAHSIVWNAQGQNSGIFFLRFEADGECDVKKVILLK